MNRNEQIYIQSKEKIVIEDHETLRYKDLIDVYADKEVQTKIEETPFKLEHRKKGNSYIVPIIAIIQSIKQNFPDMMVLAMGSPEVIVNIKSDIEEVDKFKLLRLGIVCFLLFIGSITAIINFHADVDMKTAHKTLYHVITGVEVERPLLLQIPYSLGIGAGMSVFFNHVFKKRINNEPSPLEVEMYLYQQNMDAYLKDHDQNNETKKKGSK